ncbi:hypothetical protein [Bacillus cytotoxicus]|uniref:hypothetical protein n=1 Tax=Bacillus cytotoxicus TaxID=580165 RepID=UPI000864353C|nr:hypothetical protein [Bacillus cytotoxicus]AWC28128.1 hypothetical protein CG483_006940 [Bacillus cytotoxicus]AWC40489.1 hypothetical protein CG480_008310 [Bacillus cytotoxicus]AWC48420.1 hypothetical protein CG478_008310 [Bacillus cytotoxicus]AWC52194.1 hypothetical protein CG477_006900 [Bacillus cytotoxicus]AWC56329.1 hypothetical protein CG476_006930 [Bacillus cytotoxicus]
MKRKYVLCLWIILLVSCSKIGQPKEKGQNEEMVSSVQESIKVSILQKGKIEKILKEEEAKRVVDIIHKAKKQEIIGSFGEPEYEIQIEKEGKKEIYRAWLRGESREGWLQNENGIYKIPKQETKQLLALLPMIHHNHIEGGSLAEVTKNDMQITAFHIKVDNNNAHYTIFYTISNSLYKALETEKEYYFQIVFPEKIQQIIGRKTSEMILGEQVREGYKQYEAHFIVPLNNVSISQQKAIEVYYDYYDLYMLNHNKERIGIFQNIIQIVKDYGEKMNFQR